MQRAALAVGVLATVVGCRDVLGIDRTELGSPEQEATCETATGNGLGWWSGCTAAGCLSARAPDTEGRPSTSDSADDLSTFYLGFSHVQLGSRNAAGEIDPDAWRHIGFDIDRLCTQSPTCTEGNVTAVACRGQGSETTDDGEYCRDNQLGRLDYTLDTNPVTAGSPMVTDATFNCALCQGQYTMLVAVSGYNGQPDDDVVRIDLYPSPGLETLKDVDCDSEAWSPDGCWTRADRWTFRESAMTSTGRSTYYDSAAYVRDGMLVAAFPENTPIWFLSRTGEYPVVPVILQGGMLVGRLALGDEGWSVTDGVVSGRWRKTDLTAGFERLGACPGTPGYVLVDSYATGAQDVMSSGDILPDADCDALSVGFAFEAREASVGDQLIDVEEPIGCAGSGGSP